MSLSLRVGLMGPHLVHKELALCLILDASGAILSTKLVFASTRIESSESDRESADIIILSIVRISDACFRVRFHFDICICYFPFVLGNS